MHVIDQFITGIGNYELQKHVQFGHPKSINAAIGLATEYEALEGSVDKVQKPHAGSEYIVPIVSNGKHLQSITLDQIDKLLDKKLSSLSPERRYKSNSQSPTRFPTHTTANEHKDETSNSETKSERTKSVKFCNYCKKQNHTIEECRKRKYKERQAAEKQQTPPRNETTYVITHQNPQQPISDIVNTPELDLSTPQSDPSIGKAGNILDLDIHKQIINPVTVSTGLINDDSNTTKTGIAEASCLYIDTEMFETNVMLLVDTGSPYSILSQKQFEKLQNKHAIKLSNQPVKLTAADGSQLEISGKAKIKFHTENICYEQDFIVARIQGIIGILGMDFLTKYDGSIKVNDRTLKTSKGKLKLNKQHSTDCARIFVNHDEVIQSNPQQLIPAKTDKFDIYIGKGNSETHNYQIQYRPGRQHQNADTLSGKSNRKCPNTLCPDCYPFGTKVGKDDDGEADSLNLVIATNLIEESPSYQSPATSPSPASGQAALQHTDRETVHFADLTQGNSFAYQSPIGPLVHETRTEHQVIRDSTANWLPTWISEDLSRMQSEKTSIKVILEHKLTNEKPYEGRNPPQNWLNAQQINKVHMIDAGLQTAENAQQGSNEHILDDSSQTPENSHQDTNEYIPNDSSQITENAYQGSNVNISNDSYSTADNVYQDTNEHTSNADTNTSSLGSEHEQVRQKPKLPVSRSRRERVVKPRQMWSPSLR